MYRKGQINCYVRLLSDSSGTERKKRNVDGGRNALSLFSTFTRDDVRQDSTGESEGRKGRKEEEGQEEGEEEKGREVNDRKAKYKQSISLMRKLIHVLEKKLTMIEEHCTLVYCPITPQ